MNGSQYCKPDDSKITLSCEKRRESQFFFLLILQYEKNY